jgi:hypothetical protein
MRLLGRTVVGGVLLLVLGPLSVHGQALLLEGGPPQLQIDRFVPGEPTATATDASATLVYTRAPGGEGLPLKVSVSTSAPGQQFALRVAAQDPTHGTPTGAVPLRDGMAPADLLRDVAPCAPAEAEAACEEETTLRYRLRAAVEDGAGTDRHVVRFTLLAQ